MLLFPPGNARHAQEFLAIRTRKCADATAFLQDDAPDTPSMQIQVRNLSVAIRANRIMLNFLRSVHSDYLPTRIDSCGIHTIILWDAR